MAAALGRMLRSSLMAAGAHRLSARVAVPPRLAPQFLAPAVRLLTTVRAKAPLVAEPVEDEEFDEDEEDFMATQSAVVQRRVLKLKEIQKTYDALSQEYQKEVALLQAKYYEKYQPAFDQRREVVLGKTAVDKYDIPDDDEKDEGVKEFWLTAFYNHSKIGPYITERDAEVLKHLVDVRATVLTGEDHGFELTFSFEPNKFFSNKTLTKRYTLELEDEVIPKDFVGCDIKWKDPALNPTVEQKKKRVKSKEGGKGGKPAFITESEPTESFFNIFEPPKIPSNPEDLENEELDALQEELTADFDIGFAIKDQVIPRAVEWYTGEIAPFDEDYDEMEEGDEFEMEEPEPPAPPPPTGKRGSARR